jgi:hypothetical protein
MFAEFEQAGEVSAEAYDEIRLRHGVAPGRDRTAELEASSEG